MAFTESSAATIAAGVTAIAGRAASGAGPVDVHLVRVDLSKTAVRVLGRGATGSLAMSEALTGVPNGIAAVNGDLFHVMSDGSSVTPDGPQADLGAVVKGGAGTPDALTVTQGVAGIGSPQLEGTVTIVDQLVAAGTSTVARTPAPRPRSHPRTHRRVLRKHATHRKKRKHRKRHARPRPKPSGPIHWPPGSVVIIPGRPGAVPVPSSAVATLNGVNDVDGGTGAILVTPAWGTATLADHLPSGMVEVTTDGTRVTSISTDTPVVPDAGTVALLVSTANRQKIPWLAVGDRVSLAVALTTPAGPAQTAIGGNARLVSSGLASSACSLVNDDSRRPRVAAGVYANGHMLLLVVSDGDTSDEPGLTLGELTTLMRNLGARDALNLDGGQSSTLDEKLSGRWQEVNNGPGDRWVTNVLAVVPR